MEQVYCNIVIERDIEKFSSKKKKNQEKKKRNITKVHSI